MQAEQQYWSTRLDPTPSLKPSALSTVNTMVMSPHKEVWVGGGKHVQTASNPLAKTSEPNRT